MTSSSPVRTLTRRDRALLAAVAAGRCQLSGGPLSALLVDGRCACDQLAVHQLLAFGLITPVGTAIEAPVAAALTPAGRDALGWDREAC